MEEQNLDDSWEKFNAACESLRQNDPNLVHLSDEGWPQGYGAALGDALLSHNNNQVVASIRLCVSNILQVYAMDTQDAAGIVEYIRSSSQVLRKVHLIRERSDHRPITVELTNLLLIAMMENGNIDDLLLHTEASPQIVTNLLESSKSLRSMELYLDHYAADDNDAASSQLSILAEAFGANSSLESLLLTREAWGTSRNDSETFLRHLRNHPTLKTLHLNLPGYGRMYGLLDFCRHNRVLHHLILEQCTFDEMCWRMIILALHSNTSVALLTLRNCRFKEDDYTDFGSLHHFAGRDSHLRTSRRGAQREEGTSIVAVDESSSSSAMESLVLSLTGNEKSLASFFCAMTECPSAYQIPHLQLTALDLDGSKALMHHLPSATFLRELTILEMTDEVCLQDIIQSIQHNSSLYHVTIQLDVGINRLTPPAARLLHAYGHRNQLLPTLLFQENQPLNLLPRLLKVSLQVPHSARTNRMFQGLLNSCASVGPASIADSK